MWYIIIGVVIVVAIAVGSVLVYKNNPKDADALIAKGEADAAKLKAAVKKK